MDQQLVPRGAPQPGDVFAERYIVDRILGVGGMGFVFAATHVHLREPVAIKMLLPKLTEDRDAVERFLREGRAAVKIRSDHVARVLDVGELPDRTPYLVMEYLEGTDLAALLAREGKIAHERAVEYVLQACEAIAQAHAQRTVHRDLKPSNLFLAKMPNGSDCVKVLDFGISKTQVQGAELAMTRTTQMLGTPLYMSPEQLKSARDVDERSDIWSLGVILYELMTGSPPFNAQTLAELGAVVLSGKIPWLRDAAPDVPVELAQAVVTCLQAKAEDRFVNLADFADALAPFGGPLARARADRIIETLGMPATRAERHGGDSPVSATADTVVDSGRPRLQSGTTLPMRTRTTLSSSVDAPAASQSAPTSGSRRFVPTLAAVLLGAVVAGVAANRYGVLGSGSAASASAMSSPPAPSAPASVSASTGTPPLVERAATASTALVGDGAVAPSAVPSAPAVRVSAPQPARTTQGVRPTPSVSAPAPPPPTPSVPASAARPVPSNDFARSSKD